MRATQTLLLGAVIAASGVVGSPATAAVVTAKAAILIDHDTGAVLWQRNPDLPLPPASTTKIVTALLALESGRLHESFEVSREAAMMPPSKISLRPGWQMELRDLVYAVLLNSANDASVVIAEGLAGSVAEFARRMNAQARRLGAVNTHFVNPNGLPAEDHYTTARDLATMFSGAIQNPEFVRIASTKTTTIVPAEGSRHVIALRNHNKLLDDYHIRVIGKTGWTRASKKCFVGAGFAAGREVIVAVLGSYALWSDLRALLEYGLEDAPAPNAENPQLEVAEERPSSRPARAARRSVAPAPKRFAVHLGTFPSLSRAKQVRSALARKGYPVRVSKVRQKRTVLYRVSVGSYVDRRAAEQVANRIGRINPSLRTTVKALS